MSFEFDRPAIYLITKGEVTPENFDRTHREILSIIRAAVEEKISFIQIREKKLSARLLFELTVEAAKITRGSNTHLLVNDRADIALAAGADGVHLTANSLTPKIIRASFPKGFIIGASTHTPDAAKVAMNQGSDFIVFGPVFETPGKGEPQGVGSLSEVCEQLRPFPVIALGGIDPTNYLSALDAGASGFAAIRLLNDPKRLRAVCRDLRV